MSTIVFLIHGIGKHEKNWSEKWVAGLEKHYEAFGDVPLTRKPFGERIETVEILYDDIFAGLLADWAAQGRQLAAAGAGLPDGGAEFARLGDFLGRLDGNNFATTHAADVALYRGLPLVRERVKVHVARQILTALEARATPISRRLPPWVVVAHSLGTIVAHDALDAIWTLRLPPAAVPQGGSNRFDPSQPGAKAELVMMVANVSRLLQSDPKAYVSTVMPGPPLSPVPGDPGRLRGSEDYVNTWHRFDPVTIPGRFAPVPPDWPDSAAVRDGRFQDIEVRHIHSVQIHDFLHYMADPRLHGALFQRATSPALLTDRAIERRVEEFAGSGGGLSDNAQIALKVDVESLDIGTDALWTFLLDLPKRFL